MAKLQTSSKSGFNAGDSYNIKYISIDKIVIDPEISRIFSPNEKIIDAISRSMIKDGFHKEEPLTLLSGQNILLDGHQRYAGAKKAGLVEVPYVEKNFESREDAKLYTLERQAVRRNLTGAEILSIAEMIPDKKAKNGEGRTVELFAKRFGIRLSTLYQAKSVLKNASEDDLQLIKEGKASTKKIYNKNKQSSKKEKDTEFAVNDPQGLSSDVSFLKGAVILLVDKNQLPAAELLINHYLDKNQKRGFYNLLPDTVSAQLPRLPLIGTISVPAH
ncbi:MAG: ParB/RepB/Spo0J family partition protein [Treponema sp.]|jgi:ParB-like chromosome segregation protein Spo0J|nr:ParB/RepB/Spo0J family partition protein [Treponema sp.]